ANGSVTTWTVPITKPYGLAFDGSQRVWIADNVSPNVFRFTPASNQLCQLALPNDARGPYVLERAGAVWATDYRFGAVLRITETTNAYTYWPISSTLATTPYGLQFDPDGNLW